MAYRPQRRPALRYELAPDDEGSTAERVRSAVPGLLVLAGYPRGALRADLVAGVAVAAYMIPQVMAYSSIVDLPPVVGLWTVVAATAGYALFGSSRILSAGPESTIALMAAAAVAPLTNGDPQRTLALCSGLSLVVAGWCLIGRLMKLGVVADLLSEPLLVGYLAGGAVLMVVGQLGRVTGTEVAGESIVDQMRGFAQVVADTHLPTLVVAGGTLAGVLLLLHWKPRWPGPLLAVGGATAASALLRLEDRGVEVTGSIPEGLPVPSVPDLSMGDMRSLVVAGLGVAVVAYSDNTLIGRAFTPTAGSSKSTVDANQVLKTPVRTPVANTFAERWIGSIRRELLDRTIIWNKRQLERLVIDYIGHYNTHRPHRSLNQQTPLPPLATPDKDPPQLQAIKSTRCDGLINEYRNAA